MNNNPKISIIVPVFNVENYLHRCIDSILIQTFKDFEVLLIDDGSTDKSGKICDEYAFNDNRVKVFHKRNGGVSSARNVGLNNAVGKWVTFCDSDDYVHENFLYDFLSQPHTVDLLSQGYWERRNDVLAEKYEQDGIYVGARLNRFILDMYKSTQLGFLWCKAFKLDIIKSHSLLFNENIRHMEDLDFIIRYCHYVDKISNSSKCNYVYSYPIIMKNYHEDSFPIYISQYEKLSEREADTLYINELNEIFSKKLTISLLFDYDFRTNKQHYEYIKKYRQMQNDKELKNIKSPKTARIFSVLSKYQLVCLSFLLSVVIYYICKIKNYK